MLDVLGNSASLSSWVDKRLIAGGGTISPRLEEMDIFLFIASQTLWCGHTLGSELSRAQYGGFSEIEDRGPSNLSPAQWTRILFWESCGA
jgi:hypothetical protein